MELATLARGRRIERAPAQPAADRVPTAGMPRFLAGRGLRVSQPQDAGELRAERLADEVMSAAPCPGCSPAAPCTACAHGIMRAAEAGAPSPAASAADSQPALPALSAGTPLDAQARGFFEPRFGADLGAVRVHTSAEDGQLARGLAARAFTVGSDIVFAPGRYEPGSHAGRRLLAHELAHVVDGSAGHMIARAPDADAGVADGGPLAGGAAPTPADAGVPLPAGVPAAPAPPLFGGLFGDCASEEEGRRRDAFALRHLRVERNIPSTTFGMFDADYFPLIGLMPVTVKIRFEFVSADNAPGGLNLLQRLLAGEDLSRFFWNDTEKTDFKRDFIGRVTSRWSGRHLIRSTKPCWGFRALPLVGAQETADASDAHYVATVHKSPGPGIDYKSAVNDPDVAHPERPGTADLYQSDVREEADFNSTQVATAERQRLESALAAAGASPVLFDPDSDRIRPAAVPSLTAFADALKGRNPSDPMIPLHVDGFASAEGGLRHNEDLAERRALAVRAFLASLGVTHPIGVLGGGPVGVPGDASQRRAVISVDHAFETSYASNRYSVGEHEFGHMLGLPDEYQNNTTGTLGAQQTLYSGLVASAGVPGPAVWGADTASQMSNGIDVLPRHYVTLWEALGRMTSPDITQSEWSLS